MDANIERWREEKKTPSDAQPFGQTVIVPFSYFYTMQLNTDFH